MDIIRTREFIKQTKKIKDKETKKRLFNQLKEIIENPERGDFLSYEKGIRRVYVPPFRLLYAYKDKKLYFLDFNHRDKVYKKRRK